MTQTIQPVARVSGAVALPGDRSISHNLALVASLAEGTSKITNFATGSDSLAILAKLRDVGIGMEVDGTTVTIHGRGLDASLLAHLPLPKTPKSAELFHGLFADGQTVVREPSMLPDHTEIAIRALGGDVKSVRRVITLEGRPKLEGRELVVPCDLSLAAYFVVAALLVPGSQLVIRNVGLNPTRSTLLDFLFSIGARIRVMRIESVNGELLGDIEVKQTPIQGGVMDGLTALELAGELPALAVLGAVSERGLVVRDAAEWRLAEAGRLGNLAENFARMGVQLELTPDGMRIPGKQKFQPAAFDSFGDHGIAMACGVAALRTDGPSTMEEAEVVDQVFPDFWSVLARMAQG